MSNKPHSFLRLGHGPVWRLGHALLVVVATVLTTLTTIFCAPAAAQVDRQRDLDRKPIAEVDVQSLVQPQQENYDNPNRVMMYQPEQEDPLSFYARTQDGEWQIPSQVDRKDPWVRLLLLGPIRPTLIDVAIDINGHPYRDAREVWVDKLLSEAQATSLVRAGVEAAEMKSTDPEKVPPKAEGESSAAEQTSSQSSSATEKTADAESGVADDDLTDSASAPVVATDEAGNKETETPETEEQETEEQVAMVKAQSRQARTLFKRLINYLAAAQSATDREEVRWLLAEWTGGPALLNLGPAFAWRRAEVAPLWNALNRDGDEMLSRDEIAQATQTLEHADINRDDSVDLRELERLGKNQDSYRQARDYSLIVVIDNQTDWKSLRKDLQDAYTEQGQPSASMPLLKRLELGDRSLTTAELANLLSVTADLVCRVTFANEGAKLSLLAAGDVEARHLDSNEPDHNEPDSDEQLWEFQSATEETITVEQRANYIEFSATQGEIDAENSSGDMQQTQVAVGAVIDGYPLFRLLDHDDNKKLTLREQRDAVSFLNSLDRNDDGQLDRAEMPTAVRLAIAHGPKVHQHLSKPIAAQRPHAGPTAIEAPEWFVGMDRNKDGDLSRREFTGSPTQFAQFDRDDDGLISRAEVSGAAK